MTTARFRTVRLGQEHNRAGFRCGEPALDEYLRTRAGQDVQRGVSSVFVAVTPGSNDVIGFYSLSAYSVDLVDLPPDIRKKLPRYGQVPAILLGRLAVHESAHGQKLGGYLLLDALCRSLSADIGWVIFLVQAKHERAAAFYRHFGFQPFEHSPSVLHITRKTASAVCSNC
jgi:GNAT superfamily N-acetyltransferase